MSVNSLIESISQLREIQNDLLRAMDDEIRSTTIPYETVYHDFQSGGWQTALLYTPGEGNAESIVRDGAAIPTQLAYGLPIIHRFLESLGLDYFTVRIARNDPGSWLWEHRDYVELDAGNTRLRLHVPLVSNPDALIQFSEYKIYMAPGWIWKLDPTTNHAISNTGAEPRTHLILDCYVNQRLREMLDHEILEEDHVHQLPQLTPEERRELVQQAKILLTHNGSKEAEESLLKTFHKFDLGEETSYDLLIDFYAELGFRSREDHWIAEHFTRIHRRAKVNFQATTGSLRGTIFSNPHNSSNLPHFKILQNVLQTCRHCVGLEQLYVRGSLARGDFDLNSDIDLLCIVAPHEFVTFINKIDTDLKKQHGALMERWVDTIVKDFGGIGFVYLLQTKKGPFQLDLYVSCLGHPSLARFAALPHKLEIFRRNRDESQNNPRLDTLLYRLHSSEIECYINSLHNIKSSPSQLLTELSILGFMIARCLERDDSFVALSEFYMWQKCFIKLVRYEFDRPHLDYGFYHLKQLITKAGDNGHLYEALRAICNHPLTKQNFREIHRFAMQLVAQEFPDEYKQHQEMIQSVTQNIEGHKPGSLASRLDPWPSTALFFPNIV